MDKSRSPTQTLTLEELMPFSEKAIAVHKQAAAERDAKAKAAAEAERVAVEAKISSIRTDVWRWCRDYLGVQLADVKIVTDVDQLMYRRASVHVAIDDVLLLFKLHGSIHEVDEDHPANFEVSLAVAQPVTPQVTQNTTDTPEPVKTCPGDGPIICLDTLTENSGRGSLETLGRLLADIVEKRNRQFSSNSGLTTLDWYRPPAPAEV